MKLPVWATLFTALGALLLCALGGWQLHRLQWKTALIETIDREYAKDAAAHPLDTAAIQNTQNRILRGTITGRYRHEKAIFMEPRTYEGKSGFHLITPFGLKSGGFIFVNRGWLPQDQKDGINRPGGPITLTGYFRIPAYINAFVPENDPPRDKWYAYRPAQIAAARKIGPLITDKIFMLEKEPGSAAYPVHIGTRWYPPNNHLHYALFWFIMAGVLLVIYYLRFLRNKHG